MKERYRRTNRGLTLVETLVTIAIIVVLAGLLYTASAPVRERARELHCINNLKQIAQALQMYRQDYGGDDPPEALTAARLGLPPVPHPLLGSYVRSRELFKCPSEIIFGEQVPFCSYYWQIGMGEGEGEPTRAPRFSQLVARRGLEPPIVVDPHHGTLRRNRARKPYLVIVLRLSGQVQRKFVREGDSWDW